jgi:hypothetical protein
MDDLTIRDFQSGIKLDVQTLPEDSPHDVRLTIQPGVGPQSISLTETKVEELALWLLQHLDADGSQVTLTPEDHQVLTELGIEQRPDGKWGFKLACANKRCGRMVDQCYCAEGLLEAVRVAASDTANTACSLVCWAASGWLQEPLDEALQRRRVDQDVETWVEHTIGLSGAGLWMHLHPNANRDQVELAFEAGERSVFDALRALTEAWRYRDDDHAPAGLRESVEEDLTDGLSRVLEPQGVQDPHPYQCACLTGGDA